MTQSPKVSVVMSVYNDGKYLREAIDSILNQTFKDFEFLIVDDGSTDSSAEIIRSYSDPRIQLIRNDKNIGLTRSLNKGVKLARGEYIARQDADDISLPERLEKQVTFLDEHVNVGVVSSSITNINEAGEEIGSWKLCTDNDVIKQNLLRDLNQFSHPSSMFRRKCVERVGGYRETFKMAQDYDLWLRIAEEFGVANIKESLCKYRIVHDGISASRRSQQKSYHQFGYSCAIQRQIFGVDELGYEPPGEQFRSLRRELSRGGIARRRMLSDKYFMCARRCAFKNGRRDLRMSVKYFLKSLIYNPLNLTAWRYATYRFVDKAKNRF